MPLQGYWWADVDSVREQEKPEATQSELLEAKRAAD
jgi:hypothetical protein